MLFCKNMRKTVQSNAMFKLWIPGNGLNDTVTARISRKLIAQRNICNTKDAEVLPVPTARNMLFPE